MHAANQSDQIVNVLKIKKYDQLRDTEIETNQSFVGIFAKNKKLQKNPNKNAGPIDPFYSLFAQSIAHSVLFSSNQSIIGTFLSQNHLFISMWIL